MIGRCAIVLILLIGLTSPVLADKQIIVQSTTSTANSGFYDHLLPIVEARTGIVAKVVAVGTGQAIKNAMNCDGDVLLVHAKADEEAFVAAGFGTQRNDLMYNDFVIVGPTLDPAGINDGLDAPKALRSIATSRSLFVSRGDASGTHKAEQRLWAAAALDPTVASGLWYREIGSGMGATLNTALGMGAYTLVDRATWTSFVDHQDFDILVEGDPSLFNQYGIIPVNPAACPDVNGKAAQRFANFLLSAEGQVAIAAFQIDGKQVFFPNAQRQ